MTNESKMAAMVGEIAVVRGDEKVVVAVDRLGPRRVVATLDDGSELDVTGLVKD